MATGTNCSVAGCVNRPHAKGYCRKHYGQIWRKGAIQPVEEERRATEKLAKKATPTNDDGRVRAMERELERAEMMYRNVIGIVGRLKWRRECDE